MSLTHANIPGKDSLLSNQMEPNTTALLLTLAFSYIAWITPSCKICRIKEANDNVTGTLLLSAIFKPYASMVFPWAPPARAWNWLWWRKHHTSHCRRVPWPRRIGRTAVEWCSLPWGVILPGKVKTQKQKTALGRSKGPEEEHRNGTYLKASS